MNDPFVKALNDAAFAVYREAYGRIRARYGWSDPPLITPGPLGRRYIAEPLPPGHLAGEKYSPYFTDVMALFDVYDKALTLAGRLGLKRPKIEGYDGDVRELLEYNLTLTMDALRDAA